MYQTNLAFRGVPITTFGPVCGGGTVSCTIYYHVYHVRFEAGERQTERDTERAKISETSAIVMFYINTASKTGQGLAVVFLTSS